MAVIAPRSPTLLTICRVCEEAGTRSVSVERRTVELTGREAILVESLMRIGRRKRSRRGPQPGSVRAASW